MTPELEPEEAAVIEQITRFCADGLEPRAAELDETQTFATCHLPDMADMGLMGMNLPVHLGGLGLSGPALYRAVEVIAGACGSTASMLTAHFLATDSLHLGGDAAIHERFLADAASGHLLGAFALTEPAAGSNPGDMQTRATRDGDHYHVKRVQMFHLQRGCCRLHRGVCQNGSGSRSPGNQCICDRAANPPMV